VMVRNSKRDLQLPDWWQGFGKSLQWIRGTCLESSPNQQIKPKRRWPPIRW